jgi:hypothetical protein
MVNRSVIAAIGSAAIVCGAIIGMTELAREGAFSRSRLGAAADPSIDDVLAQLAELPTPECGQWAEVEAEILEEYAGAQGAAASHTTVAYTCSAGRQQDVMPPSKKGLAATATVCAEWCEKEHALPKDSVGLPDWCCEFRDAPPPPPVDPTADPAVLAPASGGPSCAWSDGLPIPAPVPVESARSSAYTICPAGVLAPYRCTSKVAQDAIKLDGDADGLCSQICLPLALWNVAMKHGVVHGKCADEGFEKFQYIASRAGIKYNVYAKGKSK